MRNLVAAEEGVFELLVRSVGTGASARRLLAPLTGKHAARTGHMLGARAGQPRAQPRRVSLVRAWPRYAQEQTRRVVYGRLGAYSHRLPLTQLDDLSIWRR